jgi:pyruvate,water dikinase
MISHLSNAGVSVPGGFATTAAAYREFLDQSGLNARIQAELAQLNVDDVIALAETGAKIRKWIVDTPLTAALEKEIREAFAVLSNGNPDIAVAVRSSATAEDLPDASFAGQQETFLNIRGIDNILIAIKEVFASFITIVRLHIVYTKVLNTVLLPFLLVYNVWFVLKLVLQVLCLRLIQNLVSVMWYLLLHHMVWVKWLFRVLLTLTNSIYLNHFKCMVNTQFYAAILVLNTKK